MSENKKSSYISKHRELLGAAMTDESIAILYSGIPLHTSEDDYTFCVNSNFFWLTGSERQNQAIVLIKTKGKVKTYLFIEKQDDFLIRWTGKMPTVEEMSELSGIEPSDIYYLDELGGIVSRALGRNQITNVYCDTYRVSSDDLPDYNLVKANELQEKYPHITLIALRSIIAPLRETKDEYEIEEIKKALSVTERGLNAVLGFIGPGKKEYMAEAVFASTCRFDGSEKNAFDTIAASGANACSMHYCSNRDELRDGELVLFDLGAKWGNYCSDITRTYPVNGKFTERQLEFYNLVLKANREVARVAKPGMKTSELQDLTRDILGEGLVKIGLINDKSEVGRYYMHGVSHSIGIDVHDITSPDFVLRPGCIISDEPGLYIDEEGIGIRIEDDLLITEDGCICLSESIIRTPEEIEDRKDRG